ncbi:von Willebrand factor type A domain protein [Mycobacterium parascrofulaceum ATCC BAA-614]|uniref:von Willebrand factor type A domain protein n=1 Tax=Mycobacterium parascrofulaceum ATCC BAA-614 TaxID=525368 RepID=D5PCT8_9MYCO|nr:VWA domain-containing protein [Mycobacterium parascrofulaceum]EFG76136.1 von Willebrand factor type A domain protein [Mycobacterium parascrofulaceum ATCC BAA-614]
MSLPGIGPLPLYGFQRPGMLLFGLLPLALLAVYILVQGRRRRRLRRFTESSVPQSPIRHLPIAVSLLSLVLLTIALATPTHDMRIPRNRAVVVLVIDMSQSMRATDVPPNRLKAAEEAASQFAAQLTPGINLGLVGFAGTPYLLVPPTPQHQATIDALKKLDFADSTATGEAIFTALHAVSATAITGGDTPPPARIVLLSDGRENKPSNPSDPHDGVYTAARLARDEGVPISTISFGTKTGEIEMDGQRVAVPVSTDQMKTIAKLSGGQSYTAGNLAELNKSYNAIEKDIGYRTVPGPGSAGWLRLGVLTALIATALALVINRRLPV